MLALAPANALSLPSPLMIGHYDFGYASYGDAQVRPVQVFDDGAGTLYFQVHPGEPMPAVFAGPEMSLLLTQPQGTYFTARSRATEFTLALGNARAVVVRALEGQHPVAAMRGLLAERGGAAPSWQSRPVASALPGLPADALQPSPAALAPSAPEPLPPVWRDQPVLFAAGSAAIGDEVRAALAALVDRIGSEAPIEVQGLGDQSSREPLAQRRAEALREALVEHGVPAGRIRLLASGVAPDSSAGSAPIPGNGRRAAGLVRWQARREAPSSAQSQQPGAAGAFEIRRADQTIAGALRRWGADAGYVVAWEVPLDAPLTGDLRIEADSFLDAVQLVVRGLQAQGYPIRAQVAGDRNVRFSGIE